MATLRSLVWPFLSQSRMPLVLFGCGFVAVLATTLSHVATPWLIGRLIDAAPGGDFPVLRSCAIGLFATAVLASAGGATRGIAARYLADLFRAHLRTKLMQHFLAVPLTAVERDSRQLNSLFVDDVPALANLANPLAMNVVLATLQLVAALGILLVHYTSLVWLVLIVLPLNALVVLWQWPIVRARAREQLQYKARLDCLTVEVLEGVRDLKGLGVASWLMSKLAGFTRDDLMSRWRAYLVNSIEHVRYTVTWLLLSIVYYIGATSVANGDLSVGSMTAFIWYVGFLETPITRLWNAAGEWQTIRASLDRYCGAMSEVPESEGSLILGSGARPAIEFRNVVFRYGGGTSTALSGINLSISTGQQVAIVGASGAGKTTLVSLILRLFDPQEGAVFIDGTDIRQYTLASLRRYVAIISQDPFILDGTVRENICVGLSDCPDADVEAAARVADADAFIGQMPEGYDTALGTRGMRLSGGQKRRLAIARSIFRRPRILILDEVTGALDSVSDEAIQRAIARIQQGCTTITISHRLSSTCNADLIVVMDGGRIIGSGTHHTLLHSCPAYLNLTRLQELEQLKVS